MPLSLEVAIARVPRWAGAKELKTTPSGGGITNQNFRVDVDGESFVLRICGDDTDLLGISREAEYAASLAAGELGIAPQVVCMIQPEGYLVTRYITCCPLPPQVVAKPQTCLSKLDFDFRGYADLWFGRATAAIHDPRWGDWLKEITHG